MCGIVGIYNLNKDSVDKVQLERMNQVIRHRGPDDEGYLIINQSGKMHHCSGKDTVNYWRDRLHKIKSQNVCGHIGIGFRRLSILDTSAAGHQPMCDSDQNLWIAFNGEVYNYIELRDELSKKGYIFHSNTDTEVALASYKEWGIECFNRFNGMWAIVIWDNTRQELICSRDRYAIKPFNFIHYPGKLFAFSSEIKALTELIPAEVNRKILKEFLISGTASRINETFFDNIRQLPGGSYIKITDFSFKLIKWYEPEIKTDITGFRNKIEKFRELFEDSVKMRQRSDVELGYSLSGGLDSSSIVSMARTISSQDNNNTFSLVFPGYKYDESGYIDEVVKKTGFPHYTITPDYNDLIKDIDDFVYYQEEPLSGLSFYGQYKLRELYKQKGVIVSLEGQGADEIISGYKSDLIPYLAGKLAKGKLLNVLSTLRKIPLENKFKSLVKMILIKKLTYDQIPVQYSYYNSYYLNEDLMFNTQSYLTQELINQLLFTSLPYLLRQADKSAMAFSQEARFPFLDYRLVEFCLSLKDDDRIKGFTQKYILRESMRNILPQKIYHRSDKIGFSVPMAKWLKQGLDNELVDYVNSKGFQELPFIKHHELLKKIKFYQKQDILDIRFDFQLWKILSLYLWRKRFGVSF